MKNLFLVVLLLKSVSVLADEAALSKVKLILEKKPQQSQVSSAGQLAIHRDWHVAYSESQQHYYAISTDYLLSQISVQKECPFQDFYYEDVFEDEITGQLNDVERLQNGCDNKLDSNYKHYESHCLENNNVIVGSKSGRVYSIESNNTDSGICSAGYTKLIYISNISEQLEINLQEAYKLYELAMQSNAKN